MRASRKVKQVVGGEYEVSVVKKHLMTGPLSLESLLPLTEGLYPADLVAILQEELSNGSIRFQDGRYALPALPCAGISGSENAEFRLPEPHPLDYDWRFTTDTVDQLSRRIVSETPAGGHIALLGVPSLFGAIPRWRADCRVTLFDGSEELVKYLAKQPQRSGVTCKRVDLTCAPIAVGGVSDVVVCDPPWYVEYYAAFLVHASAMARIGAWVFISLLPLCTRPGCDRDRQDILDLAGRLGLALYGLEPGVLAYDTPLFERQSLTCAGLPVIEQWRRGDLLALRKLSTPTREEIMCVLGRTEPVRGEERRWREVLIGSTKIKLRASAGHSHGRPELRRIERDDILPTVSRRYPGRRNVDLWLWDNRVFGVTNGAAFWDALTIASHGVSPRGLDESVEIALEQVRRLLG